MADLSKPIGVLFVHGIGAEKQGETLLAYSEPLFKWIAHWLRDGEGTTAADTLPAQSIEVLNTDLFPTDGAPAHSKWVMHLRDSENKIRNTEWIAAECWWADTIVASSWRQTIKWALQVVPSIVFFQLSNFVRRRFDQKESEFLFPVLAELFTIPYAAFGFLVLFLLNILAGLLTGLALVQAVLPIGMLRSVTQGIQVIISQWAGDLFLVVNSPVQRSAMVSKLKKDLEWMKEQCSQVVIVAHSQGAAISYLVLQQDPSPQIKGFVSLGSAIKLLKKVESVQQRGLQKRFARWFGIFAPFFLASLLIFLLSLLPFFSIADAAPASASARDFDWMNVLISAVPFVFVVLLLIVRVQSLDREMSWDPLDGEIPLERDGFRWCDLYASNDPAPDGRLSWKLPDYVKSTQVYNRANLLLDHTTYWENVDEFVSAVAVFLSQVTNTGFVNLTDANASRIEMAKSRRRYRFGWLLWSRTIALASAIALLAFLRNELPAFGVSILEGVNWILGHFPGLFSRKITIPEHPSEAISIMVGILLVVVPILWYAATLHFWGRWHEIGLQKLFRPKPDHSDLRPFRSVASMLGILIFGTLGSIVLIYANLLTPLNGLIFIAAVPLLSIGLAQFLTIPSAKDTQKPSLLGLTIKALTRVMSQPLVARVGAWAPVVLSVVPILVIWVYPLMSGWLLLAFTLGVPFLAWRNTMALILEPGPSLMWKIYVLAIVSNTLVYLLWLVIWWSR